MQMKLCEGPASKKSEIEHERLGDESRGKQVEEASWLKEQEDRKRRFEANLKYGSTTILKRRVSETMTQTADQLHYTVWG